MNSPRHCRGFGFARSYNFLRWRRMFVAEFLKKAHLAYYITVALFSSRMHSMWNRPLWRVHKLVYTVITPIFFGDETLSSLFVSGSHFRSVGS
eukprot:UN00683